MGNLLCVIGFCVGGIGAVFICGAVASMDAMGIRTVSEVIALKLNMLIGVNLGVIGSIWMMAGAIHNRLGKAGG